MSAIARPARVAAALVTLTVFGCGKDEEVRPPAPPAYALAGQVAGGGECETERGLRHCRHLPAFPLLNDRHAMGVTANGVVVVSTAGSLRRWFPGQGWQREASPAPSGLRLLPHKDGSLLAIDRHLGNVYDIIDFGLLQPRSLGSHRASAAWRSPSGILWIVQRAGVVVVLSRVEGTAVTPVASVPDPAPDSAFIGTSQAYRTS